ncbi:hypothetical protein PC116_g32673 [Phytophthora cactorum]|nr:hypothetical protein PC116_g32673 [Phytophthora cactorum]
MIVPVDGTQSGPEISGVAYLPMMTGHESPVLTSGEVQEDDLLLAT